MLHLHGRLLSRPLRRHGRPLRHDHRRGLLFHRDQRGCRRSHATCDCAAVLAPAVAVPAADIPTASASVADASGGVSLAAPIVVLGAFAEGPLWITKKNR